jgi:hypothetical protein
LAATIHEQLAGCSKAGRILRAPHVDRSPAAEFTETLKLATLLGARRE